MTICDECKGKLPDIGTPSKGSELGHRPTCSRYPHKQHFVGFNQQLGTAQAQQNAEQHVIIRQLDTVIALLEKLVYKDSE